MGGMEGHLGYNNDLTVQGAAGARRGSTHTGKLAMATSNWLKTIIFSYVRYSLWEIYRIWDKCESDLI